MSGLKVRGLQRTAGNTAPQAFDGLLSVGNAVEIDLTARRGEGFSTHEVPTGEKTVVELELENGLKVWLPGSELEEAVSAGPENRAGFARGDAPAALTLRLGDGDRSASRGAVGWALKALRYFDVDPVEAGAKLAALALAEKIEDRAFAGPDVTGPGLYRCPTPYDLSPVRSEDLTADQPLLVLIHGTGSMTSASFGALAGPDAEAARRAPEPFWEAVRSRYGDNVFALQHRTLSVSPIHNAIELVGALPKGARLHLLSHSRGGLVGELVARAGRLADGADPFDERDFKLFSEARKLEDAGESAKVAHAAAREAAIAELRDLNRLLKERRPVVERFVRVGCPARGTTLASGKLDKYLTLLVNLLDHVPFLKGNPVVDLTKAFLLAVVRTRTRPEVIPGLEAQMPDSPLIAMLNRTDISLKSPLSVIAGDIEPSGFFSALKVYATDLFYPSDHDLVVDTSAMVGGAVRIPAASYFLDKGAEVNHFSYFSNSRTRARIRAALDAETGAVPPGFHALEDRARLRVRAARAEALDPATAPRLFLLPGIMGTHLGTQRNRIWLDYFDMALGGIRALDPDGTKGRRIVPLELIDDFYGDLTAHLGATHIVHPFPYDWRKSILENGERLGSAVDEVLDGIREAFERRGVGDAARRARTVPIRFVAHSMGGLVVRAMARRSPVIWQKVMAHEGTRVLMLGTPNAGSHATAAGLIGQDATVRMLSLLDITSSRDEVMSAIGRMRGFLELLPSKTADGSPARGYFGGALWKKLVDADRGGWPIPDEARLAEAGALTEELGEIEGDFLDHLYYIAGKAPETPADILMDADAPEGRRLVVMNTAEGDGRVTWKTGIPTGLDGARLYFSTAIHGDLARHAPDFPAITEILTQGETNRLPHAAPVARGEPSRLVPSHPVALHRPDEAGLLDAVMCAQTPPPVPQLASATRVEIIHGDLAYCGRVIAVGHYDGEVLVGAESFMNHKLANRLARRRELGLYPGGVGTADVVLNSDPQSRLDFPGTLVVGLGEIGELDVEKLTRCLGHGFLLYALRHREEAERMGATERSRPELATLLIGHRESRVSLRECVRAVLDAVVRANEALAAEDRIAGLRIVELFDDTAIGAAEALRREAGNPRFARLDIDFRLAETSGARRRVGAEGRDDWVQRIDIRVSREPGEEGSLKFTTHSGSAVAADDLVVRNRDEIDGLIDQMTETTADGERMSHLLFERLLPRPIKNVWSGGRPIQITIDPESANYPWEMLRNRFGESPDPVAVNTPVVRQLRQDRGNLMPVSGTTSGVLIVGDPVSDFPPLPGARDEAEAVHRAFERDGNWQVLNRLISPSGIEVLSALLLERHRIVHLAGHGVSDYMDPEAPVEAEPKTGMVLGPGSYLTSDLIAQMSHPPDFVFLNCCHLARLPLTDEYRDLRARRHRLAASLAVQFMRCGAKAVIAAGWEVEDGPAAAFARTFYRQMLDGEAFGRAVTDGRRAAYQQNRHANTWGAYQCYGDPDYRFPSARGRPYRPRTTEPFTSIRQAIVEIENVAKKAQSSAYSGSAERVRGLLAELDGIDALLISNWRDDPRLLAAFGSAYGELYAFDRAIHYYDRALSADRSVAPLSIVEQRANLRARYAAATAAGLADDDKAGRARAIADIERSVSEINSLIETAGSSVERHLLVASARKRLAMIRGVADLDDAVAAYVEAWRLSVDAGGVGRFNPNAVLNARLCAAVATTYLKASSRVSAKSLEAYGAMLDGLPDLLTVRGCLTDPEREAGTFWDLAMHGDHAFVEALETGSLTGRGGRVIGERIVAAYRRAWERGGTLRELGSVIETVDFVRRIWSRRRRALTDGIAALDTFHAALEAFPRQEGPD